MHPDPDTLCRCGHPAGGHAFDDGEPLACYFTATVGDPDGSCPCEAFAYVVEEYAPAEGGGSAEQYRAAWRQSEEAHR